MKIEYMTEERNIAKYIILGILTFGIYDLWCVYTITRDLNKLTEDSGSQRKLPNIVVFVLLTFATCGIYSIFWWANAADSISREGRIRGIRVDISATTVLLYFAANYVCAITSYIAVHRIFEAMNALALDYNTKARTFQSASAEENA